MSADRSLDAALASEAFASAIGYARWHPRQVAAGDLIGLEHEYVVRDGERAVDFRSLVRDLPIDGQRLDPGDVNAHRCSFGGVITADGAEAEVATPPIVRRPGFTVALEGEARRAGNALRRVLPPALRLEGYSTHLSVAMPAAVNVAATALFVDSFAAGAMLLADRLDSPGLLVRPRSGRLEVACEFVTDEPLRALTAYVTGAALAVGQAARHGLARAADLLPPALEHSSVATADRVGWGLRRDAFGEDLLRVGRDALVTRRDGRRTSIQEHLERTWDVARAALRSSASVADADAAERLVAGFAPLPSEMPARDTERWLAGADLAGDPSSPFAAILQPRQRPGFSVSAEIATWDLTVFALRSSGSAFAGRRAYAAVPRHALARFLHALDVGGLDAVVRYFLGLPASGRLLSGWVDAQRPGLYDALAPATAFIAPEATYVAVGDRAIALPSGDRVGKPVEIPGGVIEEEHRRIPWGPVGLLIGLIVGLLVGGGIVFGLLTNQATVPQPTPTTPAIAVGSPTTPLSAATPTPLTTSGTSASPTPVHVTGPTPTLVTQPSPTASPVVQPTPTPTPTPVAEVVTIDDMLTSLGFDVPQPPLEAAQQADPPNDYFVGPSEHVTVKPAGTDIVRTLGFEAYLSQSFFDGLPTCGAEVICGATMLPGPGAYYTHVIQMRGPIGLVDGARSEINLLGYDATPLDGKPADKINFSGQSFWNGTNTLYSLRFPDPNLNPGLLPVDLRLAHDKSELLMHPEDTGSFAIVRGSVVALFIPQSEWDGTTAFRDYAFYGVSNSTDQANDYDPELTKKMAPFNSETVPFTAQGVTPIPAGVTFFAPFTIPTDVTVNVCEHLYTVRFVITDSNNQSSPYEGHVATWQAYDGEQRMAFVGPGGVLQVTVDDKFVKTSSGCHSVFNPHVLFLDGQQVFG